MVIRVVSGEKITNMYELITKENMKKLEKINFTPADYYEIIDE